MTVSMRKMSPGDGYRYLLRSVVANDGNRGLSTPLTRYYAESGTPPGRWMGGGLAGLGSGQMEAGAQVHESQLALLIGLGRDPVTGDQLGRAYPEYKDAKLRIAARIAEIPAEVCDEERDAEISRIEAEEGAIGGQRAVAGFDFTFSVPKSVSVLWGVADADIQAMVVEAHHAAVAEVIDYLEREVAATRTGVSNGNGAVAQVGAAGVIVASFDHWDSRAGDPQLHTHVVISNKVKTLLDGRWRSLDSRPIHAAVTAISAHYDAVLADRLTGTLGLAWESRNRGADRNPQWEVAGVTEELIREFSSRTREIEKAKDRLITDYVDKHGRRPSNSTIVQLRAQATLATRPPKTVQSLADLTSEWRGRASELIESDAARWARAVVSAGLPMSVVVDEIPLDLINELGSRVVDDVSTNRSTWRHWNLWAAASKHTMGWRFRTAQEREVVVAMIVEAAEAHSVALTPPELALSPIDFRRVDGTSVFRPRHSTVYSSTEVMAAEDRLLARAEDRSAARITDRTFEDAVQRAVNGGRLGPDQVTAIAHVAASGRRLDLLAGPAGAGKTTAMRALRSAWLAQYGRAGVVGLAPSAAAAKVLGDDLGIQCDNTAKWLHEHERGNAGFKAHQLVIIDEATLADTRTLDRISGIAADAGAKVLLVGDTAQLQSVDAGGAFSMLAASRSDVPTLVEIHRFTHDWEKAATVALHDGELEVVGAYARHGRLREGTTDQVLDGAYAAWRSDTRAGLDSVLVTESVRAVHQLNARARAERILAREDDAGREVALTAGTHASVGDLVITRKNDRRLRALNGGWARNGDRWIVTDVRPDDSIVVRRVGKRMAASVVLPLEYVAQHVDLGYAVTAHRAQGVTVDTAHVVVTPTTTRENLYVSMTRGRDSNIAYVALDQADDVHAPPEPEDLTARTVLYGVLQHSGAELSAHETIAHEQDTWSSTAQLAAEYETIAAAAQRDRWTALLRRSGLSSDQVTQVVESSSFGPLASALRRAEASGNDVGSLLPDAVARRSIVDAVDIGAVLHKRVRFAAAGRRRARSDLIAGLIPAARGEMPEEHRIALAERERVIEARASSLAINAVKSGEGWVQQLGGIPTDPVACDRWMTAVAVVAAYRDRYGVEGRSPLGAPPRSEAQRVDAQVARTALRRAASMVPSGTSPPTSVGMEGSLVRG